MVVEVMIVNNRIRKFRLKSKLTQQQLADLMDVTRQAVTRCESGTVEPSTENLILLAQIFDCSVDELICNDVPTNKVVVKEVLVKEERKLSFWSITKANIFLYIISAIALVAYLIIRFTDKLSYLCQSTDRVKAVRRRIFFIRVLLRKQQYFASVSVSVLKRLYLTFSDKLKAYRNFGECHLTVKRQHGIFISFAYSDTFHFA